MKMHMVLLFLVFLDMRKSMRRDPDKILM